MVVVKKSIMNRAIDGVEKGALKKLKEHVGSDIAIMFSDIDTFELSGMLSDNQGPAKAKTGDIAPEDIKIEPGPTELIPGPAISELGSVGLKVAVENGKLTIKQGAIIVKAGEEIKEKVANVMSKLGIEPMKVGFIPIAAYDAKDDASYVDIKIDKKGALEELRNAIGKALGFAVNVNYISKETASYFILKAVMEEKALSAKILENSGNSVGGVKEEINEEEKKDES